MPRTLRLFLFGFLLAGFVASAGCIEFERVITLNKDLSGTAKFRMTMNMEPAARIAASMEHSMTGKPGEVTEAEVQDAIKKMTDEMTAKNAQQPDPKANIGPLPEGFTLIDVTQKLEALKMTVSATIGFKDVRKLATLKMSDSGGIAPGDADLQPFDGIEIKDEGTTLLITAKLLTNGDSKMMAPKADPGAGGSAPPPQGINDLFKELTDGMGGDAGMKKMVDEMMKGFGETFRIETPMTIVDTNATKRETGAVVWQQTLDDLMKAASAGGKPPATSMTVRLKK